MGGDCGFLPLEPRGVDPAARLNAKCYAACAAAWAGAPSFSCAGVTFALEAPWQGLTDSASGGRSAEEVMDLSKAVSLTAVVLAVLLATGYAIGHQETVPEMAKAATTKS